MDSTTRRHRSDRALAVTPAARRLQPIEATVLDLVAGREAPRTSVLHGVLQDAAAAAEAALDRALRDIPRTRLAVAGPYAETLADWLRQGGREANPIAVPLDDERGKARKASAARHPVIVASGCLEHAENPAAVLNLLKRRLAPDGVLILTVANLAHASVRLAMLLGTYPFSSTEPTRSGRAFTAADTERLLNGAGFTVAGVERHVDAPEVLKDVDAVVPRSVIDLLASDQDALTSHFAFVAVAGQSSTVRLLHHRVRQLSDEQRSASKGVERLGDRLAELELRVRHWAAETDALTSPGVPTHEALSSIETRIAQIAAKNGEAVREAGQALAEIDRLDSRISALNERVDAAATRERELQSAQKPLRDRLVAQTSELKALIGRIEQSRYRRLIARLRRIVRSEVPEGATVLVVSRGDHELVKLDGCRGWHFPQADSGVYAGHHPADSNAAIAHLEALRKRGATHLVIPRTGFWWLDHYRAFGAHLEKRYTRLILDERVCVVFALRRERGSSR